MHKHKAGRGNLWYCRFSHFPVFKSHPLKLYDQIQKCQWGWLAWRCMTNPLHRWSRSTSSYSASLARLLSGVSHEEAAGRARSRGILQPYADLRGISSGEVAPDLIHLRGIIPINSSSAESGAPGGIVKSSPCWSSGLMI